MSRKHSRDPQIDRLTKQKIKDGWTYSCEGKHGKLYSPRGFRIVVPGTPSDWRQWPNFKTGVEREERLVEEWLASGQPRQTFSSKEMA